MNNNNHSHESTCRGWKGLIFTVLLLSGTPAMLDASTIGWEPPYLDFGAVPVGSTETRTLTLTNTDAGMVLIVSNIEYTFNQQGAFGWSTAEALPVAVGPGDSMEVVLSFTPPDFSFFMADLLVTSNALNTPNGLVYSFMGQGEFGDICGALTDCGGVCVDVTSDINNCGYCANSCPTPDNADAMCENSNCGFVCNAGYEPLGDECIPVGTSIADLTDLLIEYWYDALEETPTIVGLGPGKSAEHRRDAFENMLLSARELVFTGDYENACGQLRAAYLRSDGGYPFVMPPDFVAGEATLGLGERIVAVIEELDGLLPAGCSVPEPTARP